MVTVKAASLALALSASSLATQGAAQAADGAAERVIGNWRLTCETGLCQAYFGIQHPTEDWLLLRWSILHDSRSGQNSTILRVPTGIALQPGLRIWTAADKWIEVPFQVCDPQGCEAIALIDDGFRDQLVSAAGKVTISFIAYGEQRPTAFEVSIAGFEEAMAALPELR